MDASLMVLLHLPRDKASTTPSEGNAMESPGHTSHDGGDASDEQADTSRTSTSKKRKSTYMARKEEMTKLAGEALALREQLQQLKGQQLRFQPMTVEEKNQTSALRWQVTQSRLAIANAQSLVSSYSVQFGKPLIGDYIHLPRDPMQRQEILDNMKTRKMDEALVFLAARCQHVDLTRYARQIDSFETSNLDIISNHWGVTKIEEGQPTVRRAYDEMLAFAHTSEMAIAEKFGLVGVRESDPWEDRLDATQFRMLTSYPPNFLVEKNLVIYTQYFPRSQALDQPHGVFICDYVDQDDEHPYQPHERIRKDVSSVYMIVECPTSDPDEPRSVVLVSWAHRRIHHSHLATEEELHSIAREGTRSFYDMMVHTIREKLACQV